ncbi:lysis protein [Pseudomonas sp. PLMAX]|jgi:hypothetical protein|uniref:lysis protein n=1 Tax=Pseudomonas sp. PLMAX TaxID=2201998 RepID=UPI0038BA7AA8
MNAILLRRLPYIAALLIGAGGAWMWQANSYGKQLAEQALLHQSDLDTISNAAAAKLRTDQDKRHALEQRLSASERTHYKELSDAQINQKRLRDHLATSDLRLSVLLDSTEPAGGCAMPAGTEAVCVVHGGARAQLDPAHAQRIVAITDDGDQGLIALRACQTYVREISR